MHLGNRGGGDGLAETFIKRVDRRAELIFDNADRLFLLEGRQLIAQAAEIAGKFRPDHVGARGKKLPELDI